MFAVKTTVHCVYSVQATPPKAIEQLLLLRSYNQTTDSNDPQTYCSLLITSPENRPSGSTHKQRVSFRQTQFRRVTLLRLRSVIVLRFRPRQED